MELVERDFKVFREVARWRFCLGRHLVFLAGFTSQRVTDRRIKALLSEGYLTRHKVLYGVPNVYQLTSKTKKLIGANLRQDKIRLDQIMHDIAVLDVAIAIMKSLGLSPADIKTEKQLHQESGFGKRVHHPDFVFIHKGKNYCVEVELSLKSKARLEKNIKANFLQYDVQVWVLDEHGVKLKRMLQEFKAEYPNMKITSIKELMKK